MNEVSALHGSVSVDDLRAAVRATEAHVRSLVADEPTGHDWYHAHRVRNTALRLAENEGADPFVVELAALLHDVDDYKFSGSAAAGPEHARRYLATIGVSQRVRVAVAEIIAHMSFEGALVPERRLSVEGQCVQDADRLDASGAIGIARTFAYGGFVGRLLHDPDAPVTLHTDAADYRAGSAGTINHFYEKLLHIRDRMNTATGRALAERRHDVLVGFLDEFSTEWEGRA
jgi:uncharacterized protein